MTREAWIAASRFGLGPTPLELAEIGGDPRGWLARQIPPAPEDPRWQVIPAASGRIAQAAPLLRGADEAARAAARELGRATFASDLGVRAEVLADTAHPFLARWRLAWSNHFTVSVARPVVAPLAVPFERDVVAAHATGRFLDLVRAATLHPAMLLYLDNARSVGPDSLAGRRRSRGLNENLARELLELHTLGVDGGYGQADVEALAQVLTGWSLTDETAVPGTIFRPELHQPGKKVFLDQTIPEGGPLEIEAAIAILAKHPSTARNVAVRLARHFVADAPPERAIRALERAFLDSEGDLAVVAGALIDCDAAWSNPLEKLRTPHDLVLAVARGFGPFKGELQVAAMRGLGQLPFTALSPAGWSDRADDWAGSDQVLARVDFAERLAEKLRVDPVTRAEALLGPVLSERSRAAIRDAAPERGLALLLASPEFQRR